MKVKSIEVPMRLDFKALIASIPIWNCPFISSTILMKALSPCFDVWYKFLTITLSPVSPSDRVNALEE